MVHARARLIALPTLQLPFVDSGAGASRALKEAHATVPAIQVLASNRTLILNAQMNC